jgi:Fe-S cluster assembly protein SufD
MDQAPWLRAWRDHAFAQFSALGLPSSRDEEWKHTSVAPMAKVLPRRAIPTGLAGAVSDALGTWGAPALVFVNGFAAPSLSSLAELPPGVVVRPLGAALRSGEAGALNVVRQRLGQLARGEERAFVALNGALFEDGALVQVARDVRVEQPIHLVFLATGDGADAPWAAHPRCVIVAEPGSQATFVETYQAAPGFDRGVYFTNAVTELAMGAGALVEHHRVVDESEAAFHVGIVVAEQGRDSRLVARAFTFGGALVRGDVHSVLAGEGGECTLRGLYLVRGSAHVDHHTTVEHARAHTSSRELYKGVLAGTGAGVFNGRIIIRPDAQKVDASQTNRNLILSDRASINTKPQLEIFANDVKCAHGATVGQLDRDAIFYLRARGIDEGEARRMLMHSFTRELVEDLQPRPLAAFVDGRIRNWLALEASPAGQGAA